MRRYECPVDLPGTPSLLPRVELLSIGASLYTDAGDFVHQGPQSLSLVRHKLFRAPPDVPLRAPDHCAAITQPCRNPSGNHANRIPADALCEISCCAHRQVEYGWPPREFFLWSVRPSTNVGFR